LVIGWYTAARQSAWKNVWNADEEMVKQWIADVGPVVTTIYASGEFGSYSGGVLNARDCCNQSEDPSCRYRVVLKVFNKIKTWVFFNLQYLILISLQSMWEIVVFCLLG
jgi:hypothetical protein